MYVTFAGVLEKEEEEGRGDVTVCIVVVDDEVLFSFFAIDLNPHSFCDFNFLFIFHCHVFIDLLWKITLNVNV